jgi:molybdopterin-containing oxidoreductase family iron-sulfur binding subunit
MHCELAPCEPVCPVSATVHDEEGINSMAYNRCIGTRYCANNCPYKVRRYNYLDFTHTGDYSVEPKEAERMKTLSLQRNPDVTVRYRGVMEKCTFCTQRIEEAKIATKRTGGDRKALTDGAAQPACAQACPTQAITFGNINDPKSKVAQLKTSDRNYEMLQELNIRPRTTYLARIKNPNEELA